MFQLIFSALTSYRIDIKNSGIESNAVELSFADGKVTEPSWYTNSQGIGKILQGNGMVNTIKIKAINDGILHISFLGQYRSYKGQLIPIWINYKSIKIDGKEILFAPIETWHNEPFKYEMPVKDGQEIYLEFEQQYHKYIEDELKTIIQKCDQYKEDTNSNIDEILNAIRDKCVLTQKDIDERVNKHIENIVHKLSTCIINVKNTSDDNGNNHIAVTADGCQLSYPGWMNCGNIQGVSVKTFNLKQSIHVEHLNKGNLSLTYRAADIPGIKENMIDYYSIKVNGRELLDASIKTTSDKPYKYEIEVEDNQCLDIEFEQKYHSYTENELRNILVKLNYDENNIENIIKNLSSKGFMRTFAITKIYAPDNYLNVKKSYKLSDKLSYETVKGGICIPQLDEHWSDFYGRCFSLGHILDTDGKYVLSSAMKRQELYTRSDTGIDIKCKNIVHKKAIYLGCFINQYGHFILQGLSRLWFLLDSDYKDYDLIYVFLTSQKDAELPKFMEKILSLFGIELSKLTRITEPTQYDEIIVPEVSFAVYSFWTNEYKNTIDKIKESITPVKNDKIYLSRCHYKDNIIGEVSLEKTFTDNGYKIIYPEELSVEEQIAIISGADDIVTSTGTIAHNLIFAKNGAKCAILERGIKPNSTQPVINEMRNLDSSYIMANYSILPVLPSSGPYILGVNQYMQKFFEDNDIVYNKEITDEYIRYLLTYQYIWYRLYSNERAYNDLKVQCKDVPEYYFSELLEEFKDIFDGKKIQIVSDKNLRSV